VNLRGRIQRLETRLPPVKPPEPEQERRPLTDDEIDEWAERVLRDPDRWLPDDVVVGGLKPNWLHWAEQRLKMRAWRIRFDEIERQRHERSQPHEPQGPTRTAGASDRH
jgi:hypothetical protein